MLLSISVVLQIVHIGCGGAPSKFETAFADAQEAFEARSSDKSDSGCSDAVLKKLRAAEQLAPKSHNWLGHLHFYLATCYDSRNHLKQARKYYGKAIRVSSNPQIHEVSHHNIARSWIAQSNQDASTDWDRMRMHAAEAVRLNPNSAENQQHLAVAEFQAGDANKGLQIIHELRRNHQIKSPTFYAMLAMAMANSSTPWSGIHSLFREGLQLFPDNAHLTYQQGRMAQLVGDEYATQSLSTVLPSFQKSQELSVIQWMRMVEKEEGLAKPALKCRGKPKMVYDWADSRRRSVHLSSVSLPGSDEYYGRELPRRARQLSTQFTWGSLVFPEREPYVATFRGVFVAGEHGVIFDSNCRVFLTNHAEEVPLYRNLPSPRRIAGARVLGASISLVQLWGTAPYHVLVEVMARVLLLQKVISTNGSVPFLIPANNGILKNMLLEAWGIAESNLELLRGEVVHVSKLYFADWRQRDSHSKALRDSGQLFHYLPPRRAVLELRVHYSKIFPLQGSVSRTSLLILSRGGKSKRQFSDKVALLDRVRGVWQKHHKTDVEELGERFPALAVVHGLFARAAAVLGVHGAGLGNIIFCEVGTHVIEIACRQPHGKYFAHLAMALSLEYWWVPLDARNAHLMQFVTFPEEELLEILETVASTTLPQRLEGRHAEPNTSRSITHFEEL